MFDFARDLQSLMEKGTYMRKQRIRMAVLLTGIICIITMLCIVCTTTMIKKEFAKQEKDTLLSFELDTSNQKKSISFEVYPWSKYEESNIQALTEEQQEFVKEKQLAECIVELMNYDEVLIADTQEAINTIYDAFCVLHTSEQIYYTLYCVPLNHVYLFAMADVTGELFSFHYVSDYEYEDGGEALKYIQESYVESEEDGIALGQELSPFQKNREKFCMNAGRVWEKYHHMSENIFWGGTEFYFYVKPDKILEENGTVMVGYRNEYTKENYIYYILDKKTRKICGYHIENVIS